MYHYANSEKRRHLSMSYEKTYKHTVIKILKHWKTRAEAPERTPCAWDGCSGAARGGRAGPPGSSPGTVCWLLSRPPPPGAPLPSELPGPAAGGTFASAVASCTAGLHWSV